MWLSEGMKKLIGNLTLEECLAGIRKKAPEMLKNQHFRQRMGIDSPLCMDYDMNREFLPDELDAERLVDMFMSGDLHYRKCRMIEVDVNRLETWT